MLNLQNEVWTYIRMHYLNIYRYLFSFVFSKFITYAGEKGIKSNRSGLALSGDIIEIQLMAYIARNFIDNDGFYYALIENLKVDFKDRLSIITGETGAGKSIMLGAMGLIMGNRATDWC